MDGLPERAHEILFEVLIEVLTGHLDGEHVLLHAKGHNGCEPGLVVFFAYLRTNDIEAIIPGRAAINFHQRRTYE
jgi:hypothetical protein